LLSVDACGGRSLTRSHGAPSSSNATVAVSLALSASLTSYLWLVISAVWTCRVLASRTWGNSLIPYSVSDSHSSALSCGCCISASETEAHHLEFNPMMPKLLGDSLRIIRKGSVQRCSEHAPGGKTSHVTGPRSVLNAFYQFFLPAKESESSSWCNTHLGRQRVNGQPSWRGTQQKTAPNCPYLRIAKVPTLP
jgi:hypothetical protein